MENFFDPFVIIILLTHIVKYSASIEGQFHCPIDCVCYPDYLSNLVSWKWIEKDIHLNPDDLDHKEFNPYTQHNEVYDNPNVAQNLREEPLKTVNCILRGDTSVDVTRTFNQIPSDTQVLSLLQAAGSGNVTLGKEHFEHLHSLIGIEIQGYTKGDDNSGQNGNSLRLAADAFTHLHKLTYLNLEKVVIQQRSLRNKVLEYTSKIVKITRVAANNSFDDNDVDEDDDIMNELESQLMFLSPTGKRDEGILIPYNEYKKEVAKLAKNQPVPVEPKVAVAFSNLQSLIHLRISRCNMQDMSWDMFYRLHNLKYLLLERNDLLFLPDFAFYATSNLTALSLSGNRILSLQTVGLAGLLYLQKLDMTNNNITHLSELSLPPFPRLEVADFRFNPIETIFPNTFEVMNTTKTLYIGSPKVPLVFFPNSFYGLASLTKLDVTNVRIGFLERPMLKGIPHLQHLLMNGHIRRISYDAFSEVPKLETLILKNCGIEKISMDAFYGLTSLVELDLSRNQLSFLAPGIFEDQVSLREVYLQHNKLTTLSRKLFMGTPAKMIRLEGNPWHCSCEMSTWNPYIVNKVKRYHIPRNGSTFCQVQYDKGSMCNQEFTGFKVKYVYEKRVSPICETPNKFNKRSVFEVIRKELRYCGISTTTPTTTTTEVHPAFTARKKQEKTNPVVKPMGSIVTKLKKKNIKSEVVKTAEQLVKEQEKRLMTNPVKIRKPTPNQINVPERLEDEVNIPSTSFLNPTIPSTTETTLLVTYPSEVSSTPMEIITSAPIEFKVTTTTPIEITMAAPIETTTMDPTSAFPDENQLSNLILFKTDSIPDPTSTNELKPSPTESKPRIRPPKRLPQNPRVSSISKKAMKFAKFDKMNMMLKTKS